MAQPNQAPPIPPEHNAITIQSMEDIIQSLHLKVHSQRSADDQSIIVFACIPDPDQNIPEHDNSSNLDPGPIRAQLLLALNNCSGSSRWTIYNKQRLTAPRGASCVRAVMSLDKVDGDTVKKKVCAL